ncbi:hypothetical protein, partial [Acidovorax sp.]|uniref:hypothetical protein n=1 Tax=Acidovorax sp. TaxID=1872122 RepID=UPI0025C65ACC
EASAYRIPVGHFLLYRQMPRLRVFYKRRATHALFADRKGAMAPIHGLTPQSPARSVNALPSAYSIASQCLAPGLARNKMK